MIFDLNSLLALLFCLAMIFIFYWRARADGSNDKDGREPAPLDRPHRDAQHEKRAALKTTGDGAVEPPEKEPAPTDEPADPVADTSFRGLRGPGPDSR